jgi:hypothetical protein
MLCAIRLNGAAVARLVHGLPPARLQGLEQGKARNRGRQRGVHRPSRLAA